MTEHTFHTRGNYAPVAAESTAFDLPVTGAVPPELNGWYVRNGPNPRTESRHWFLGEGMLHGVRLENGRAACYRNRWVRTEGFDTPLPPRPDGSPELTGAWANTHVVSHAGRTLALEEASLPYEVTRELETVGPYDFGGGLTTPMTAHPKICPETGELHFFGYAKRQPYLTYHRADAHGTLRLSRPIEVAGPTMMHEFTLTSRHVVFLDLPVVLVPGGKGMPYRWDPGYGARIGLLPRTDPHGAVRWFPIDPCYVFHTLNAYEAGDEVVLYAARYAHLWWEGHDSVPAHLWRWRLDLRTGAVREEQLDDRACEFPRIDDRLAGLDARYGHVTAGNSLVRYDLHTGSAAEHAFGADRTPGEAAFAPPRWLITYVHDRTRDASDLVILDATDLSEPVATIELPARVPAGFHGNWLPDGA
ncbi:carotenoid oxygenase family protein [Streptomyces sp. NPDC059398]|uniref:carotenoid oxygenase family protein n=1 Tax=Streptomyces sp. NPDC059398 TaxID=3346820 RepID=UPI0036B60084